MIKMIELGIATSMCRYVVIQVQKSARLYKTFWSQDFVAGFPVSQNSQELCRWRRLFGCLKRYLYKMYSIDLSIHWSIDLSICRSIDQSINLSVYLSICLDVAIDIYIYICVHTCRVYCSWDDSLNSGTILQVFKTKNLSATNLSRSIRLSTCVSVDQMLFYSFSLVEPPRFELPKHLRIVQGDW